MSEIRIVFDGPPGPESGRFVETEDTEGRSISVGEWHDRPDGLVELRIGGVDLIEGADLSIAKAAGAKFTPTPEEIAAKSYLDWPDEALGKFTKHVALKFEKASDKAEGFNKVLAGAVCMLLANMAAETNAGSIVLDAEGVSRSDKDNGNWRITIEKVEG